MSASKKNKEELELERKRKAQEEEKANRNSMRLYGIVGAVCAVAVVALLVLNSGILQRSTAAVTINGTDYSAADMQYFYNLQYQTYANYGMYGLVNFDYTVDPAEQVYNEETGESWEDFLMDSAKSYMEQTTAVYDAAVAAGHTMSADAQESVDSVLSSVETTWIGTYTSRDAFLRAQYGPYMTYGRFVELLEREMLASDYANTVGNGFVYEQADYDAYYADHADELDTFTFTQFVLQCAVPTSAEGEEELTDEEKAAELEKLKAEKKPIAEEILAKLEAGEDAEAIAEEYEDVLYSSLISTQRTGSSVSSTAFAEWMLDAERKNGDTTISEYEGSTVFNYYVVRYEGRALDKTATADVRHVLVAAETDEGTSVPTEAQYAEAKEKARLMLEAWDGTEAGFAVLAAENSADTSSAANGGLLTGVSTSSGYIQEFTDWALDPTRKAGDTGLVQNTGSSVKGWHIMYYVGEGDPYWMQVAEPELRSADYAEWEAGITEGYEAVEGFGANFL